MYDFIVDYKDAAGRYLHSSFKVPDADSITQAARAIHARLAAGGFHLILATCIEGDRTLAELDALTYDPPAGLRYCPIVFDRAELLAAGREVS